MVNVSRAAAFVVFCSSGTLHFVKPKMFEAIVPPGLPNPGALVAISGAAEVAGAIGLAFPLLRRPAAYGLIALLIAVFPANVYMALAHERFSTVAPAWALFARLPMQAVLIAWIWGLRH